LATITGGSSADTLNGTSGADSIMGLDGADHIFGDEGNDTIDGGAGYDIIDGGGGFNVVSYASATSGVTPILSYFPGRDDGRTPDQLYNIRGIIGSKYNDLIVADWNDNSISGGAGNDTIDSSTGVDTLSGGAGNDHFVLTGGDQTIITDFARGQDKIDVSYAYITSFESLNLSQSGSDTILTLTYFGHVGTYTLKNVSVATLSASDFIFVPKAPSILSNAAIVGGYVNAAHNTVTQSLTGIADKGATITVYDHGLELGTAVASASTGAWSFALGHLADGVHYLGATASYATGPQSDWSDPFIFTVYSKSAILGGDNADTLNGTAAADYIQGRGGNDFIQAGAGEDTIDGGDGDDTIDGGDGLNIINGQGGFNIVSYATATSGVNASITGNSDNSMGGGGRFDTLYNIQGVIGSRYDDYIIGELNNPSANSLSGGAGSDTLDGRGGADTLAGGAGYDVFVVDTSYDSAAQVLVTDFVHGEDKIDVAYTGVGNFGDLQRFLTQNGADTVLNVSLGGRPVSFRLKNVSLATLNANDFIFNTSGQPVAIPGTNNADTLVGTSGADFITGLRGADSLVGLGGIDTIKGGEGDDTIDGGVGYDSIDGEGGYNFVSYATATAGVVVNLHPVFDSMGGGGAPDLLYNIQGVIGSSYNDFVVGDLNGNRLSGGGGDDTLDGAGGGDTLRGGSGADVLTGGVGNDIFRVDGAGQKTITDFTHGQDRIDVSAAGVSSFDSLKSHLTQVGADTVLSVIYKGQAATFTLKNVSLATLGGGDFVFAPAPPGPAAPTGLADASIVGGYVNAAHDTAAQVLTGTADKGSTVTVYDGATKLGTTAANATTGAWSFTLGKLADGAHSLTATAANAAAQVGPASAALKFAVDTKPPAAPTSLADAAVSAGHVSAAANVAAQALTGMAEAGATVTVYDGAAKLGAATANGAGAWSYTLGKLSAGSHSLTASAADVAGNTGGASTALVFSVDAPAALATPSGLADAAITKGYVNKAGDTASQTLTGTAGSGVTVTVYDGATKLGATTAGSSGAWSYTLGHLADGAHKLTAIASDAGGHVSTASAALSFTVDTGVPAASIGKAIVGASATTLTLGGVSEPGATLTVSEGVAKLGSAVADASGAWSLTLSGLTNTLHSLELSGADAAGNKATAGPAFYSPVANATIVGTTGSDLLIGRRGDTLTGGVGSDMFVLGANAGRETITDFTASTSSKAGDVLQIDHTLAMNFADLMSHAVQRGADVRINFPSGDSLLLQKVQLSTLHAGDFLFA